MATLVSVGKPAGHVEGLEKVTGRARYAADIALPGVLWGKCLRSPFPHARIVSIDTSRARQFPGVNEVITAADIPDILIGRSIHDYPVLAKERVRFIGEKVAAVAAASKEIAEEAINLIDVSYEELPAVFDPLEAMQDDAPRLHDNIRAYEGAPEVADNIPNVVSQVFYRHGDVEAGFAQADRIFEHTFYVPAVHQGYLEPHACVVQIKPEGKINVWIANKRPFLMRSKLAKALNVPEEQIRINLIPLGGDFGGKGSLMDTVIAYFLAQRTGRPVKMVMTYTEEMIAGNPRHSAAVTIRTGVTKEGYITARRAKVVFNIGAYGAQNPAPNVNLGGSASLGGPYRIPNVDIESLCVYTNTLPRGNVRAPGAPQAVFALESHMDMIAEELGLDRLDFRLRNILEEGDLSPLGQRKRGINGKETLIQAAQVAGWGSDKEPNVGRGIGLYERPPGGGPSNTTLTIDAKGHITLLTGVPDTGTGSHTILQQIVAEELQIPLDWITVTVGSTDEAPYDPGIGGSRVTHSAGQATLAAAKELKDALLELAAPLLGCSLGQVKLAQGSFIAETGAAVDIAEVMERAARTGKAPISRSGGYTPAGRADVTSFVAQIAEVEVDPETGQIRLRKVVSAHDVGTIINPLTHQGQIDGGVVQGIGQALIEDIQIEDGVVTTANLGDYKLPNIADLPELTTVLVEGKGGPAPYEGKAIGELANNAIVGAIANAVYDAVSVRLTELPVSAEKVYRALRTKGMTAIS